MAAKDTEPKKPEESPDGAGPMLDMSQAAVKKMIEDNKVTFRPVKVGIAGEKHFEVLSGLKEGEKIVAGTYQAIRELKDGTLVRANKADSTNTKSKQVAKS